jgi:hypothetical protein
MFSKNCINCNCICMKCLFKFKNMRSLIVLVFAFGLNVTAFGGGCVTPGVIIGTGASVTAVTTPTASITFTWALDAIATDVYIQVYTNADLVTGNVLNSLQVNDGSQAVTGFTCGTTYYYRLRNYNSSSGGCFQVGQTTGSILVSCATCTDGIQNGTETGVDCGGSCPACAGPTCTDGVRNGTETGIDCGGTCPPCVLSCNDGILNGMETGVDCGGGCPIACNTNTGTVTGTSGCTGTELATIYSTNCDQVGTSAYDINSPAVLATSTGTYTAPPGGVSCGTDSGEGRWARFELDADVTSLLVMFEGGSMAAGNSTTYVAAYNTNSACPAAGDYVDCGPVTEFNSGLYYAYNMRFDNLDPSKDVWLFFYNDNGKSFSLTYNLIGVAAADIPANQSCATAVAALDEGCNLGASGASWPAPESTGINYCGGGTWSSNENTVYYSFTADATSGSLEVDAISCNEGVTGAAQFGVWTSCASIGTYGAGFLGCQVGTTPLSLSPLVDGQTYYIAVDGNAGDNCAWAFTGTGIVLPIEYAALSAFHDGEKVMVNWSTSTEINNDFFTIQRTVDGRTYENIGTVKGAGNSSQNVDYTFIDYSPYEGTSYYRVKQTDFDGKYKYSDIRNVNSMTETMKLKLVPNPADIEVNLNFKLSSADEIVINIFDISGLLVYQKTVEGHKGVNTIPVDLSDFGKGIYNVKVITSREVMTEKLSVF